MSENIDRNACNEYNQISRRTFVGGATFATMAASMGLSWLPKVAFAKQQGPARDVIISVFLRGGADALNMVVPYNESRYYALRPTQAVPQPGSGKTGSAVDLDGQFGLHPGLTPLLQAFQDKHFSVVHAVGAPSWTRSHFEAQKWMELSVPDHASGGGWLGRHLASIAPMSDSAVIRGISLTDGLPRTLLGAPNTLPLRDMASAGFDGNFGTESSQILPWLRRQYDLAGDSTRTIFRQIQLTYATLGKVNFTAYNSRGAHDYGTSQLALALKSSACLIKSQVGVEAIHIDVDGWDTHANQGTTGGGFDQNVSELGASLGAFYEDMMASGNTNFVLVVMSEFGRDVNENESKGTDHGTGGCMLVLGGHIVGGKVIAKWPGLENLLDGHDLQPTTDYRDVLAEIVQKRLGNPNIGTVFPAHTFAPVGIAA